MKTLMQIVVILALLPMATCTFVTCVTCATAVPDGYSPSGTNAFGGDWEGLLTP